METSGRGGGGGVPVAGRRRGSREAQPEGAKEGAAEDCVRVAGEPEIEDPEQEAE